MCWCSWLCLGVVLVVVAAYVLLCFVFGLALISSDLVGVYLMLLSAVWWFGMIICFRVAGCIV